MSLISPQRLRPVNDLTRLSGDPGRLQYHEYVEYLRRLEHIKRPGPTTRSNVPQPLNSQLQYQSTDNRKDLTDWRAEQALWNLDDLPDVLYYFRKPDGWLDKGHLLEPPPKSYLIFGKTLRDVPILPDHISSDVEGWRVETWMRFDPRVSYSDIYDRINPMTRPKSHSTVQMRVDRFRGMTDGTDGFRAVGWTCGKNLTNNTQKLYQELLAAGIDPEQNTTRGLSWGLMDRSLSEAGGRVPVPRQLRDKIKNTVDDQNISLHTVAGAIPSLAPEDFGLEDVNTLAAASTSSQPYRHPHYIDHFHQYTSQTGPIKPSGQFSEFEMDSKDLKTPGGFSPSIGKPRRSAREFRPSYDTRPNEVQQMSQDAPDSEYPAIPAHQLGPVLPALPPRPHPLPIPLPPPKFKRLPTGPDPVKIPIPGRADLTLKTHAERANLSPEAIKLLSAWFPGGSEERFRQLEYVLDPLLAQYGFVDNHGYFPSIPYHNEVNCTDVDIVYTVKPEEIESDGE